MMKKLIVLVLSSVTAMTLCLGLPNRAIISKAASDVDTVETQAPAENISEDDALAIAVSAAGFSEGAIQYPKILEDNNHEGTEAYKVIFYVGPVEFSYCITKATGDVIDKHVND